MNFKFSLETLLNIRERRLEAAQTKLAMIEQELFKLKDRDAMLKQTIAHEEKRFHEQIKKGIMAEQYSMIFEYVDILKAEHKQNEHEIAVKQHELNKARGEISKLYREKELVEKLKKKEYTAWLKDELHKEQKTLDEYTVLRYER